MPKGNFFTQSEPPLQGEHFKELLRHKNLVIERIVSSAEITPVEYVQTQDGVLLLQGEAVLSMAGESIELGAGDYIFIPAGVAHTVQQVSPGTVWLAVHLFPMDQP